MIMRLAYKHVLLMVALLVSVTAWGQYNPPNPPEPGVTDYYTLTLLTTPSGGGYIRNYSTNTPYQLVEGTTITLRAVSNDSFRFVAWSEDGIVISTSTEINYTMKAQNTVLTAHFEYNPNNPNEPDEPVIPDQPVYSKIFVSCNPSNGGKITGVTNGESYVVNTTRTLKATPETDFSFVNWTEDGEIISTDATFNYKVKDHDTYIVANFAYTPSNPGEPGEPKLYHKIFLVASPPEGCKSFNIASGTQYLEGTEFTVKATASDNYLFDHWSEVDGSDMLSDKASIQYVMPKHDVTLIAHFVKKEYNPSNPDEPGSDNEERMAIYGMTENALQGEKIHYPVYLENTRPVSGLYFDIIFPKDFPVDLEDVRLGDRTANHELESKKLDNEDHGYRFQIRGEDYFAGTNGMILDIPVTVPDTATMGKIYPVRLLLGFILKNDSSEYEISARSGYIYVEKLSEDGLYARFSFDKYQDRAQFHNTSSGNAKSYLWDFGDGKQSTEKDPLHVYSQPGNYSVKLTVYGDVDTDVAEELVVIDDPVGWRVDGQFYLADDELGARHFKTVEELFTVLNRGSVKGNTVVNVFSGTNSDYELSSAHLSLMQGLYNKFNTGDYTLTFNKRGTDRNPIIRYGSSLQTVPASAIATVLSTCDRFKYRGVDMRVCGILVDAQALIDLSEQTINSGAKTQPVDFSLISPDLSFSWTLKSIPENVTGYIQSGTGALPAMTIVNENAGNYTLEYEIKATASGVSFYQFSYRIHIVPALVGLFNDLSPANGAVFDNTNVTLSWNEILNAKYDVYLWNAENERPSTPMVSGTSVLRYSNPNFLQHGNSYKWQIVAYNGFQEVVSDTMTFSINNLADLHIYNLEVSNPESGKPITINWKVKNDGTGPTGQVQWNDYIWMVQDVYAGTVSHPTNSESWHRTRFLKEVPNIKALEPGESYDNSVEVILPDSLFGDYYILVAADMYDVKDIQWNSIGGSVINPYNPQQDGTSYRHLYAYTSSQYNKIYEADETTTYSDNFFYKLIHIEVPPMPDLQVQSIRAEVIPLPTISNQNLYEAIEATIPSPLTAAGLAHNHEMYSGKRLKVTATVVNKGGASIDNKDWQSTLYMSSSSDYNVGQLLAMATTQTTKTSLEPNQSIDVEFDMVLPYEWYGDTYFHVYADINDDIYELANTVNNWGTSGKYDVQLTPGADFKPQNLSTPSKVYSTSKIRVKYDVKNIGPGIPYRNNWKDKVYISQNKNGLDDNAICIAEIPCSGYFQGPYLPPSVGDGIVLIPAEDFHYVGDEYSISRDISPGKLSNGTYYLYVKVDATDDILEYNGEDNNVIRSGAFEYEYIEPDLTIELVSISADTLETGATVAFTWKVKNIGTAEIQDAKLTDAFYATKNQDYSQAEEFAVVSNTIWLAAGAEKTLRANITIPKKDYLDGLRYVFMKTNIDSKIEELQNLNNRSEYVKTWFKYLEEPTVTPARGPALSITDIDIVGELRVGNSVKIRSNVYNYGDQTAEVDVSREFYFTDADGKNRINCEITNREGTTAELLPGSHVTLTTTITVPTAMRGGNRRLYIHLDKENALHSRTDGGCLYYRGVTVSGNVPHLDIESNIPDTIYSTASTELSWRIKNNGDWVANQGMTKVYISNDSYLDVYNDVLLTSISTNSIEAGASIEQSATINVDDRYNGRRYIIISHTGENYYVALPVTVCIGQCPDLQVSSVQTNEILKAGEPITISYRVINSGDTTTHRNYWADAFYLASSTILDKNNALHLGSRTHSGVLHVGDEYEAEVTYTIPANMQGNYMLFVVTDDGNGIYETEENNNQLGKQVYVNGSTDRPSDLVISHLSVPTTIKAGEPITVKYDITNVGDFEANGTLRDVIYFSKDPVWDLNDQMVGVVSGDVNILSGHTITRQATGSIINMVEGSYYVIVKTNSIHAIAESTDTNNVVSTAAQCSLVFSNLNLGEQAQVNNAGYFRLKVPGGYEGKTIGVYLTHPEDATVGLYSSLDQVPSTAQYDLASFEFNKSQQEVLISDVHEGDYYILAQDMANVITSEGYEFKLNAPKPTTMTLTAREVQFGPTSLSLTEGGTGGWVTTDVRGAMFDSIMDYRLINESHMIPAELTHYQGRTISRVTFNLNKAETGFYDVETELPNGTVATLPQGFQVIPGTSVALGVRLDSETAVHAGNYTPLTISYANGGTTDIEIVEILIVIENAYLSTTIQGLERHETAIHIIPEGEPDSQGYVIIPPGEQEVVNAFLFNNSEAGNNAIVISVYLVE